MSSISAALIRRGTEIISARLQTSQQPLIKEWIGIFLVFFTVFAFGLAITWVAYTCAEVIATLAAIEDPNHNSTPYIHLDNQTTNPNDPELTTTTTPKPITSDLRTAINHLRTLGGGGTFSTFRGFRMYLAFIWLDAGLALLIPTFIPVPIHMGLVSFMTDFTGRMFLATWQMAWVHLVIADKPPIVSYRRMLGYQHWRRIAPVAVLHNVVMSVTYSVNLAASRVVGRVIWVILGVPVKAIFTRVAASMLPEGLDPIVPFDRRFGGKVISEGGGETLGITEAWTTFEWSARVRYFKVFLKVLALEVALGVLGGLLVIGELKWLLYSH
ncbi:hypothetical protein AnigIFM63604_000888 [Aspergillus niger]|uniref:Uncharacterized protein n=1 Tax=Aspergillus niger TaxID=5061 RepID=A0A9W6A7V5_ASPNG|nr:hypothetical protein AnigIFM63604_000888 [Aspergillus niger]